MGERVLTAGLAGGISYGWPGAWSSDRIEQTLHYRHFTYIAVKAICNAVAGLEPQVAIVRSQSPTATGGGSNPSSPSSRAFAERYCRKSYQAIQPHEQVIRVGDDHPLVRLFRRPNPWDVSADLWYELFLFLELTGNGYLWVPPSRYGLASGTNLPAEVWVIPSHWVWPHMTREGIDHYEVRPFVGPGMLRFPQEEVIHVRYKSPIHKIDGYSAQTAGSEWIDAAESVDRSRFYQFKNGCFPIGAVELDAAYNDPDDAEMERLYAKFFSRIQGEQNYGRPIIMPPGSKYSPLTIAPVEMGYVESSTQLRDWVLMLFGVPKEIAGVQDAGSEIAMYGPLAQFYGQCVGPKLRYLGQVLTRHLASRYSPDLRVWWEDPTPNSPAQVNSDLGLDLQYGLITPNEARAVRGRQPYSEGDEKKYAKLASSGGGGGEQQQQQQAAAAAGGGGAAAPGDGSAGLAAALAGGANKKKAFSSSPDESPPSPTTPTAAAATQHCRPEVARALALAMSAPMPPANGHHHHHRQPSAVPSSPGAFEEAGYMAKSSSSSSKNDWDESKHKRDHGKFARTSGGGGGKGADGGGGKEEGGGSEKKKKPAASSSAYSAVASNPKLAARIGKRAARAKESARLSAEKPAMRAAEDARAASAAKAAGSKSTRPVLARLAAVAKAPGKLIARWAGAAEHEVMDSISRKIPRGIERCPPKLRPALRGFWIATKCATRLAFASYLYAQKVTETVFKKGNYSDAVKTRTSGIASTLDGLGAKGLPLALEIVAHADMATAGLASFIPVGSAAFLCYCAARHPVRTAVAAVTAVKDVFADAIHDSADIARGEAHLKVTGQQHHKAFPDPSRIEAALKRFADEVDRAEREGGDTRAEWLFALTCAAMDRVKRLDKAIDLALKAIEKTPEGPCCKEGNGKTTSAATANSSSPDVPRGGVGSGGGLGGDGLFSSSSNSNNKGSSPSLGSSNSNHHHHRHNGHSTSAAAVTKANRSSSGGAKRAARTNARPRATNRGGSSGGGGGKAGGSSSSGSPIGGDPDFRESDHPRGPDGQFVEGAGGGGGGGGGPAGQPPPPSTMPKNPPLPPPKAPKGAAAPKKESKKPAAAAGPAKKPPKATAADIHARIADMKAAGRATDADVDALAAAMQDLTVDQIKGVRDALGLKGSGAKAALAKAVAEGALRGASAAAEKAKEKTKGPAGKKKEEAAPAAKFDPAAALARIKDMRAAGAATPADVDALEKALGGLTVAQINEVRQSLGVGAIKGVKAKLARGVAEAALAGVVTPPPPPPAAAPETPEPEAAAAVTEEEESPPQQQPSRPFGAAHGNPLVVRGEPLPGVDREILDAVNANGYGGALAKAGDETSTLGFEILGPDGESSLRGLLEKGLLEPAGDGKVRLTAKGQAALESPPPIEPPMTVAAVDGLLKTMNDYKFTSDEAKKVLEHFGVTPEERRALGNNFRRVLLDRLDAHYNGGKSIKDHAREAAARAEPLRRALAAVHGHREKAMQGLRETSRLLMEKTGELAAIVARPGWKGDAASRDRYTKLRNEAVELNRRFTEAQEAADRGAAKVRAALCNAIAAKEPLPIEPSGVDRMSQKASGDADSAVSFLGRIVSASATAGSPLLASGGGGGGAPAAHRLDRLDFEFAEHPDSFRANCDGGGTVINITAACGAAVHVHEIGHAIEFRVPGVLAAALSFVEHRCGGERPTKMKTFDSSGFYDDDEEGRKDDFAKALGGSDEQACYVGKTYGGKATELVSMSLELLYRDPAGFAARDPEWFGFTIGLLDGTCRRNAVPKR